MPEVDKRLHFADCSSNYVAVIFNVINQISVKFNGELRRLFTVILWPNHAQTISIRNNLIQHTAICIKQKKYPQNYTKNIYIPKWDSNLLN